MQTLILVIHILLAISIVGLVLLQKSDGGGALGIGGGGNQSMGNIFTARGSANLLTRFTAFIAVGFFATSLILAVISGAEIEKPKSLILDETNAPITNAPAVDAPAVGAPIVPSAPITK